MTPSGRRIATLLIYISRPLRHTDGNASGQCHVALATEEALARKMDRHERGGASRLNDHCRPAKVQLVRNPRTEIILIVRRDDWLAGREVGQISVWEHVKAKIRVDPGSGVDSDQSSVCLRFVASVYRVLPSKPARIDAAEGQ